MDRESIERRQEIGENWGIVYNQKVRKAVDVRPVRAFHVKREYHEPFSVTFSKDGKYLAVGFGHNGRTIIYDVQTGQEFWLVPFLKNSEPSSPISVPVH